VVREWGWGKLILIGLIDWGIDIVVICRRVVIGIVIIIIIIIIITIFINVFIWSCVKTKCMMNVWCWGIF